MPCSCKAVQHAAIARQFVVLVEGMQFRNPAPLPGVHRLPGNERHSLVDAYLGDCRALHAVGPAPQDLPVAKEGKVRLRRLGQQDHVAARKQFLPAHDPGDMFCQICPIHPELGPVALLDENPASQCRFKPGQVGRMNGKPVLVLLIGCSNDTQCERLSAHSCRSFRVGHSADRKGAIAPWS